MDNAETIPITTALPIEVAVANEKGSSTRVAPVETPLPSPTPLAHPETDDSLQRQRLAASAAAAAAAQPTLLVAAQAAAKHQVLSWLRAVLRETALQAIQHSWLVSSSLEMPEEESNPGVAVEKDTATIGGEFDATKGEDTTETGENGARTERKGYRVELTVQALDAVRRLCRQVADAWATLLQRAGHHDVADWIHALIDQEEGTLYYHSKENDSKVSELNDSNAPTSAAVNATVASRPNPTTQPRPNELAAFPLDASTSNDTKRHVVERGENGADESSHAVPSDPAAGTSTVALPVTVWSRLRRLGEHDPCGKNTINERHYQDMIATLDEMGRKNETYWPRDQWPVIQQAAAAIPARLYPGSIGKRSNADSLPEADAKLTEDQVEGFRRPDDAVQQLLDRKRKSAHKKKLHPSRRPPKMPRIHGERGSNHPDQASAILLQRQQQLHDYARLPSRDNGTAQWHLQKDILSELNWSDTELRELSACLHDTPDITPSEQATTAPTAASVAATGDEAPTTPSFVLLGSLRELGRFHHFNQWAADHGKSEDDPELLLTPKQQRRLQREAISVRLGDHIPAETKKDRSMVGRGSMSSLVMRTLETLGPYSQSSSAAATAAAMLVDERDHRHWMDLDLGHCLMVGPIPDEMTKGGIGKAGGASSGESDNRPEAKQQQQQQLLPTPRRMLCAFGGMELLLEDENGSPI